MNDHRVIESVLDCLDRLGSQCDGGQPLDQESAADALRFFREYADHCHHDKEEDLLFPVMEAKGFSREQGPTGVMLYEHEVGRRCVRAMAAAVTDACAKSFAENARAFSALLREHIQKEDHCLFAMADQALTAEERRDLRLAFERFESDPQERQRREASLELARRLAEKLGVPTGAIDRSRAAEGLPESAGATA